MLRNFGLKRLHLTKKSSFYAITGKKKTVPATYVSQFGLVLENGVVKCKGGKDSDEFLGRARNPILLPAKHDFVQLII